MVVEEEIHHVFSRSVEKGDYYTINLMLDYLALSKEQIDIVEEVVPFRLF